MQEAVRLAVEQAKASDANRVHCLRLRVGAMSGVVPDALHFAFELLCRGTIAEGATLEVESVPARCWCAACAAEFAVEDFFSECPRCHVLSTDWRGGRELEITSVEIS